MKKMLAMILALMLALAAAGAAIAEEAEDLPYAAEHPGVEKFDGYWVSDDCKTLVEIGVRLDGVEMLIFRTPGEKEFTSWEYLLTYDDAAETLNSDNGMKGTNKAADNGDIAESQYAYEDGKAVFAINEEGRLTWQDEKEDAGAGLTFRKIGCFEGDYMCDRASISFRWNEDHYAVDIDWADSAFVNNHWQFVGEYDPENETVTARGFWQKLTYKEGGEIDETAEIEEREVSAVFSFDGEFHLIWDSPEGEGDGMLFENQWTPAYQFEL